MDIEKLIERLKAKDFERDFDCTPFECGVFGLIDDAATALSTLQAENEKLRGELEKAKAERDAAVECLRNKCPFCRKYLTCQGRTINNDCWEFFGLKED